MSTGGVADRQPAGPPDRGGPARLRRFDAKSWPQPAGLACRRCGSRGQPRARDVRGGGRLGRRALRAGLRLCAWRPGDGHSPAQPDAAAREGCRAAARSARTRAGQARLARTNSRTGQLFMPGARCAVAFGLFDPSRVLDGALAQARQPCLTPGLRQRRRSCWREGLRTGVGGAVSDARIYASHWGFSVSDVSARVRCGTGRKTR